MLKDRIRTEKLEEMDLLVIRICNLDIDNNFRLPLSREGDHAKSSQKRVCEFLGVVTVMVGEFLIKTILTENL